MVTDNGHLASGGLTVLVELDVARAPWEWSVFAEVRDIGVECADGCETGGEAAGVGVSYVRSGFGVGGGLGALHRSLGWHIQPHGKLSFTRGIFRAQVRAELPEDAGGAHYPILVGLRIPLR